ncbi:hypothetical protein [Leptospira kmetyi]|nr:hypothetical protein [Leptospira kmetyi]
MNAVDMSIKKELANPSFCKKRKLIPLEDSDTFFFIDKDGELLYMDRRDAIRYMDSIRSQKNQTNFNDAA